MRAEVNDIDSARLTAHIEHTHRYYEETHDAEMILRYHPEWNARHIRSIGLKFSKDGSGLMWNGAEKTADLNRIVQFVLDFMRVKYPDFGLNGKILAQGADIEDRC